jgi:hypothetical protein
MKHIKIVPVLLFVILLFAACGQEPAVSITSVPTGTSKPSTSASVSVSPHVSVTPALIVTPKPSASATVFHLPPVPSSQVSPGGLYNGPYGLLPMSVPEISEADRTVFNPDRIFDYLLTCPFASDFYTIVDCEVKGGRLYLTVRHVFDFIDPSNAYFYIKDAFALTDEYMLSLPVFSKCAEELEEGNSHWDNFLDFSGYKSKTIKSIPVASNAKIYLTEEYGHEIDTVQEFIDKIVNKGENFTAMGYFLLDYEDEQITGIYTTENECGA